MGLYLAIFDGDEELEGVEVGSYADFNDFRNQIILRLESDGAGSRFPILMDHSDIDGFWEVKECILLEKELEVIKGQFEVIPAIDIGQGWKIEVARLVGLKPKNLDECFFDVDGEPLTDRLIELCQLARRRNLPILFQ